MLSVAISYTLLFIISIFYNKLVARLERAGQLDGFKALLVVGGIAYTLLIISIPIGAETAAIVAGAFVIALAPMVWGDVARHIQARQDETEFFNKLTKNPEEED